MRDISHRDSILRSEQRGESQETGFIVGCKGNAFVGDVDWVAVADFEGTVVASALADFERLVGGEVGFYYVDVPRLEMGPVGHEIEDTVAGVRDDD